MKKLPTAALVLIAVLAISTIKFIAPAVSTLNSSSIENYLENVNFSQISPLDRGSFNVYEGNILTVRNQCGSILKASQDKLAVDITGNDLRTIYRNAANLDYMRVQNKYTHINAAWNNYADDTLQGYKRLGSRVAANAVNDSDNVDVESIFQLVNACRPFESNLNGFAASLYEPELENKSDALYLSSFSGGNRNSAIQLGFKYLLDSELPEFESDVMTFKVKDKMAFIQYGNQTSPIYVENNRLKLALGDGWQIKQSENNRSQFEVFYLTY